ncbi:unnamed protein product [Rhizophagus irregularis]|uniref:Protein kinase domain-containing protein n=1 Tax=Rhizophagus irregularis TaxID=588596 RepID=A0A915Z6N1_9GLOM|nr:unnamed protein product [Rhizophagus irregularis]CAB5364751.1 unnamed protein product [Rhizophagus irregularis]
MNVDEFIDADEFIDVDEFIGVDEFIDVDEFMDKIKNIDKYYLPLETDSIIRSMFQNYKDFQSKKLMDQSKKLMDQSEKLKDQLMDQTKKLKNQLMDQSIKLMDQSEKLIEWTSYSQFTNVKEIARGGFGIIYCATTRDKKSVILKKFKNSQDTSRYFLNELKSNQNCYEIKHHIIRIHGNLGPEFAKKSHPKAIYTSRPLSFFISKCSSINSSQGYSYISEEQGFDIDIESYTSGSLSVPVTSLGKRNIEELNIEETNNDSGKHVKLVYRNIE